MKKTKKPLSILLSVLMILSVLPLAGLTALAADPDEQVGYSVYIFYDGLRDEIAAYESVHHEIIEESFYVIPENPDTQAEGLNFIGFYCSNTEKLVQIGESVPLTDFQEKTDGYYLYLSARFSEKEKPGVTYTDKARYFVGVYVQSPDNPYDYLDPSNKGITHFVEVIDGDTAGKNVGTVTALRTFRAFAARGMNFLGYRSLLTGNYFDNGETIDVDKLPEPVFVGYELEEINETEGNRILKYEINDYLECMFEYHGLVGGFVEPMYECTVNYYTPVAPKDDEETTGDPLQFFAFEGSDVYTMAMADYEIPMELNCQPQYMEDLGYVFEGYGAMDDDEITYPDGTLYIEDYTSDDNAGHLVFNIKLFYTEADEDATEEELIAASKVKVVEKYQDILDDASASEGKKAIASAALADIEDAADREEMKLICRSVEKNLRLQDKKDMAIAEVKTIVPEGEVTDEMQAVLDQAAADIQASGDADGFEDILTEARSEINRLQREIVNFKLEKEEAVTTIQALADENASDAVKATVADAATAAANAKTNDELAAILLKAQTDVAALKEAEAAAKALAEAKQAAKAEIDAAVTNEALTQAAEEAKAAIDAAKTVEEVEAAKTAGLDNMANVVIGCEHCGLKEHKNIIDKVYCIIMRVANVLKVIYDSFKSLMK